MITSELSKKATRWSTRRKATASALALTALVGVAGATQVSSAHAEYEAGVIARVTIKVSEQYKADWNANRGKAWATCKHFHPETKSVAPVSLGEGSGLGGGERSFYQDWNCKSTG